MGAMIGSALYIVYLLISVVVFPAIWPSPGVKEAKMFCSGTTAAYRKGNDVNSYDTCYGSNICSNDWDEVEAAAQAASMYGWAMNIVTLLLVIVTMVLIVKKHAKGLNITWKLLAVMPLLFFLDPILQLAVSNPALMIRYTGNEFYVMAAKDLACGIGGEGPDMSAGFTDPKFLSIESTDEDYKDGVKSAVALAKMCKDVKFVGAPDKEDDLKNSWGMHPCKDTPAMMMFVMPFLWYFVFYLGLLSYLIFNIWSLKEELAGAPAADTEMGAAKPAVAVATATAKA